VKLVKTPRANSIVALRRRLDVTPESWYRMSVKYQAEVKRGGVYVIFTKFDKVGRELGHGSGQRGVKTTGGKWYEMTVDTKAPKDTTQLVIEFLFYDDQGEGVAWIDDFTCAKIEK